MQSSIIFTVLLSVFCISFVSTHPSFYYSKQNSINYHPPYDFTLLQNQPTCSSTLCDPLTQNIISNPNYSIPASSGQCTNIPPFMSNSPFDFDACCTVYDSCLQQCGPSKSYCDLQFYGCMWYQCGVSYRVRPADRISCRGYATCYASYMSNSTDCDTYNNIQSQACTCAPIQAVDTLPEYDDFNVTKKSVEERQDPSPTSSPVPSASFGLDSFSLSLTASPVPSASFALDSFSLSPTSNPVPSSSFSLDSFSASPSYVPEGFPSSSPLPVVGSVGQSDSSFVGDKNEWGTFTLRPIPSWSDVEGNCPPYFGNYIAVMSDQEFNEINFWSAVNSGSALKVWWKLF